MGETKRYRANFGFFCRQKSVVKVRAEEAACDGMRLRDNVMLFARENDDSRSFRPEVIWMAKEKKAEI